MNKNKLFFVTVFFTIAVLSPCFSQQFYSGEGGSDITLAIYEPQPQGNVSKEQLHYIQSMLNNNFNRFSAIKLIDQQYLDRIVAEQDAAASGRFSDEDYIRIGALVNAQYRLFGTVQNLSANSYRLNLSISDSSGGLRKATFVKEGSLASLVYDATEALLKDLGVLLTNEGRQELQRQQRAAVQAEQRLAKETSNTDSAFMTAIKSRLNYAERSYLAANIFYQGGKNLDGKNSNGAGVEVEGYIPFVPFIVTGVSAKFGFTIGKDFEDDGENAFFWSVSPVVGIIWPARPTIRIFSDFLLDFGKFGYLDGIGNADWFAISYDVGVQFHIPKKSYVLDIKYRGSFYNDLYTNAVALGVSMWWGH